jgi:hypothetical protein
MAADTFSKTFKTNGRGGRREGAGRKRGIPNKITSDLRLIAQPYGPAAVRKLAEMAGLVPRVAPAENEGVRVMAIRELLDRAYGRSVQPVAGDRNAPLLVDFRWSDGTSCGQAQPDAATIIDGVAEGAGTSVIRWAGEK